MTKAPAPRKNPKKEPVTATIPKSKTLRVAEVEGQSREEKMSELAMSPIIANTVTTMAFAKGNFGELDLTTSMDVMTAKAKQVKAGNLSELEATLTVQAATLDTIFNEMARRAAANMGEHLGATETYLRLAFKAQAQCRATIETLAEVKYPKAATFIKQANIAQQQQVNNTERNGELSQSRTEKNIGATNELLEANHGERLDTRATGETSGGNPHMEAVGTIYGASN